MKLIKALLIITLLSLKSTLAYIDPGTGGMIISSSGGIVGLIIAMILGFFSKRIIKPFKRLWEKIKGRK